MKGVTFLNPQKIHLVGETIKNCLFVNNETNQSEYLYRQVIFVEGDILKSNFIKLVNTLIQFNQVYKIEQNTFYGLQSVSFKNVTQIVSNNFIGCHDINIILHYQEDFLLETSSIVRSFLKIYNNQLYKPQIKGCLLNYSSLDFKNYWEQVLITSSNILDSMVILNNRDIGSQVDIYKSVIYQNDTRLPIFYLFGDLRDFRINIVNSIFSIQGGIEPLVGKQQDEDDNIIQINFIDPRFQFGKTNIDFVLDGLLFNQNTKSVIYSNNQLGMFIQIDNFNRNYPMIKEITSTIYFSLLKQSYYFLQINQYNSPSTQRILYFDIFKNNASITHQIIPFFYQNFSQQLTQIFPQEQHIILLKNQQSEEIEFYNFTLYIQQNHVFEKVNEYSSIVIPYKKAAIKSVEVTINVNSQTSSAFLNKPNNYSAVFNEVSLQINRNIYLNQIEVRWQDLLSDNATLTFYVEFCNQQEFLMDEECVKGCDRQISGFLIELECTKGFYQDVETNKCKQCPYQCEECIDSTRCEKCFSPLLNDNGVCKDMCNEGMFYNENKCDYCQPNCRYCEILPISKYQAEKYTQCQICKPGYFLKGDTCEQCHIACKECFDGSDNNCTICSYDHHYYYNKCQQSKY